MTTFSSSLALFKSLANNLQKDTGEAMVATNERTKKISKALQMLTSAQNGAEVNAAIAHVDASNNPFIDASALDTARKLAGDFENGSAYLAAAQLPFQDGSKNGLNTAKMLMEYLQAVENMNNGSNRVVADRNRDLKQSQNV